MAANARVCVIGPECTGKTMLAEALARELRLPWVPEYAREYAARGRPLTAEDVEPIARGQIVGEDSVTGPAILDTDLISTVVYARFYYGGCPEWIEMEARRRRAPLYLLCDTDIAWLPDDVRAATGDDREEQFKAFRASMHEFDTRWLIVSGSGKDRLAAALKAIRA